MMERSKATARREYRWAVFTGNFAILQEFLLEKENRCWNLFYLLDVLLRGFAQVVLANNPISGLLIVLSLAVSTPGTLIFSGCTAFLGLLLSMLLRETQYNIANGLTVYNPLLIGAVSFAIIPKIYGSFDAFSILFILLGTIFSVYLTRSLGNITSPFTAWPFNLAELSLIFVLYTENHAANTTTELPLSVMEMDNATSDATTGDVRFIGENATNVYIDWGMVFQGIVVSASQVFAVESVVTGSIVYLSVLLYSPTTAGFAFLGALIGSLGGLLLGVKFEVIYSGFWGYNTFLTGAALGGQFFVLNGQTAAATLVAIVYTTIVQYALEVMFKNLDLPVLSLPFVLVTSLFLKLRNNPEDETFPRPLSMSFPEKQRYDYLVKQRALIDEINDSEDSESNINTRTANRSGDYRTGGAWVRSNP